MEILLIFLTILLVLAVVMLLKRASEYRQQIPLYHIIRNIFKRRKAKKPEPVTRMLTAVRRRRTERNNLLKFEVDVLNNDKNEAETVHANMFTFRDQDYQTFVQRIADQIQQLLAEWTKIVNYEWGFHGSDYGLPSSGEGNWLLFASFIVPDHAAYRSCLAVLESDHFLFLRDHCEVRLLYGEKMTHLPAHVKELFR